VTNIARPPLLKIKELYPTSSISTWISDNWLLIFYDGTNCQGTDRVQMKEKREKMKTGRKWRGKERAMPVWET